MRTKTKINIISIVIYLIGIILGLIIFNYIGYNNIYINLFLGIVYCPVWTIYTLRYLREVYLPEKFTIKLK